MISTSPLPSRALHSIAMRILRTRQRSAWACLVAVTLVFKSFVPLLAVASAQMQGKAVAEVCSVYGVALPATKPHVDDAAAHAMQHMAGMEMPAVAGQAPADHDPADHASHSQDHCALTGLGACAAFAATLWALADWVDAPGLLAVTLDGVKPPRDASARWLALRLHAPPRLA